MKDNIEMQDKREGRRRMFAEMEQKLRDANLKEEDRMFCYHSGRDA